MRDRAQLTVLLLISTLPVMTGAVLSPALPDLRAAFGGGEEAQAWARWALTTPALFTALGAPLSGVLADRMGRRPVLLASLLLFSGGGSAGALLGSLPAITVSRAVLGLAAGGIGTAATTLIVDYYDDAQSQVLGGQAAVMALSAMIYTVVGGLLTDVSWRAPFGLYVVGLALVWPAGALLPEPAFEAEGAFDSSGPVGPATRSDTVAWRQIGLLYSLAFSGLAVFNLIRVELPYALPTMGLQSGLWIAVVLSGGTVTGALASAAYDWIRSRVRIRGTLTLALGLFASGFGTIAVADTPIIAILGVAIAGGGMGTLVPSLSDGVGEAAPPAVRGRLMGGLSTLRNLGRFASPLLAAPVVVGDGAAAPFVGAALVSGTLTLALSTWTFVCVFAGGLSGAVATDDTSEPSRQSASSAKHTQRLEGSSALCRT